MDIERHNAEYADLLARLANRAGDGAALNPRVAAIVAAEGGIAEVLDYTGCLYDAMTLLPIGTWFNWNHFGFSVVPNIPVEGGMFSNATDYHSEGPLRNGAPVSYEASAFDSHETRRSLPRSVCRAALMARRTPILKALAVRNGRFYVVQTGHGPMVATPEGTLADIPSSTYLTADGRLVPWDEAVHGHGRVEDPDA